jgi:hypothetical protein
VFNFGFPVSSSVVLALLLAVVRGEKGGKHGTRVLSKEFFFCSSVLSAERRE